MATAGYGTFDGTGGTAYEDDTGCSSFIVLCITGSSVSALVNIPALHEDGEFIEIPAGKEVEFHRPNNGIRKVTIKGKSGTTTVSYGVTKAA